MTTAALAERPLQAGASAAAPLVRFEAIDKRFATRGSADYAVLERFDLDIGREEIFCLLGPSGCGKSTVLNLLAGFERPSAGAIRFDGRPVTGPGADRGVVFQSDNALYGWLTALQNVEFALRARAVPRAARREASREMLHIVGLSTHAEKFPHELSGGMRQRVQIARILASGPAMLLLDEPFGSLDAQTRVLLQAQLHGIVRRLRKTVLMITHDIDEAIVLGDRIGIMRIGPRSHLKQIIPVDLGARRVRTAPEFVALYGQVHDAISDEVAEAGRREALVA